jgi:biofilm protein TabA
MSKHLICLISASLIIAFSFQKAGLAQNPANISNWSKEDTDNWYNNKQWLDGLQANPLQAIDKMEFSRQYHANKLFWDKAFAYLKHTDLTTIAPGKYPIDGENVFATVSDYSPSDNSKWEAHKKYIDIQYIISGKETMGKVPLSETTVVQEYNETKDVGFFETKVGNYYVVGPGSFLIFFPTEAHRPGLKTEGFDKVKKIVIKVKAI